MKAPLDLTVRTGLSSQTMENLQNLLEISHDPCFRDMSAYHSHPDNKNTSGSSSSQVATLDLDITRVSNRLLVMGRCWTHRTDKDSHRNNIDDLALFLNVRYEKNYVIWNLGSSDTSYDPLPFNNQVMNFTLSRALSPSLKILFNVCRSMAAWLTLDPEHVAIVQCKNGQSRSGLVMACFLRYCEIFDSTYESFEYFVSRRCPGRVDWVSVTLRRYLRYFNDVLILDGRIPNPHPLQLHQVILNTVPNFDGQGSCNPGIEVFNNGKLSYSSRVRQAELDAGIAESDFDKANRNEHDVYEDDDLMDELRSSKATEAEFNPLVLKDRHHVVFRLDNLALSRDIQIRVYHHNEQSAQNMTILNLVFNTGFVAHGVIRLRPTDMEIPFFGLPPPSAGHGSNPLPRFEPSFSVDIIVTPLDDGLHKQISFENATLRSRAKNLVKLSQFHVVRPDPELISPLELQGHRKFFSRLALQLRNNDIHLAHEFLSGLVNLPFHEALDQELIALGKSKYEKLRAEGGHRRLRSLTAALVKHEVDEAEPLVLLRKTLANATSQELLEHGYATSPSPKISEREREADSALDGKDDETLSRLQYSSKAIVHEQSGPLREDQRLSPASVSKILPITPRQSSNGQSPSILSFEHSIKSGGSRTSDSGAPPPPPLPSMRSVAKSPSMSQASPTGQRTLCALPGYNVESAASSKPLPHSKSVSGVENGRIGAPPAPPLPGGKSIGKVPAPPPLPGPKRDKNGSLPPPPLPGSKSSGNIPPPPPPLPGSKSSGMAVPPPPLPPGIKSNAFAVAPPDNDEPEALKLKIRSKFHWEELKDRHRLRNSIWLELLEQIPDYDPQTIDVHKFEELFCVNGTGSGTSVIDKADLKPVSKPANHILDLRRVNNVGIGLSRFYKRLTDVQIVEAIVTRHTSLLSLDDLLTLKPLMPTQEEQANLMLYAGPIEQLGVAEKFMYVAANEPHLAWMVDSLIFERQFDSELEAVTSKITSVIGMLVKIRESPALKILLRAVLDLGNLANYDYGQVPAYARLRGKALGFKMESLICLQDVKSVDKKTNLLQYLIMTIRDKHPEVLSLPSDFSDLHILRYWDTSATLAQIEDIAKSFRRLRDLSLPGDEMTRVECFRKSQQVFLHRAASELEKIGHLAKVLKDTWHNTAEYLGEDTEGRRPEDLFIILDQFFRSFADSIVKIGKQSSENRLLSRSGSPNFRTPNKLFKDEDDSSTASTDISGLIRSDSMVSLRSSFGNLNVK